MKFRFGLDVVLKDRERLEKEAQRDYAEAQKNLDDCLQGIKGMYDASQNARKDINQREKTSTDPQDNPLAKINSLHEFILGQSHKIKKERQRARGLMSVVEEKQSLLIEASKNRKALEKLKERKLEGHLLSEKKKEAKELDDLMIMRNKRSQII